MFAVSLQGQDKPSQNDPLERHDPQSSILHFLEACHSRDYTKASYYLDLHRMTPADRAKAGPELSEQLEDLLDDTAIRDRHTQPRPRRVSVGRYSSELEHLDTFQLDGQVVELNLQRVALKNGVKVWLVSADSVELIPQAHKLVDETYL